MRLMAEVGYKTSRQRHKKGYKPVRIPSLGQMNKHTTHRVVDLARADLITHTYITNNPNIYGYGDLLGFSLWVIECARVLSKLLA